MKKKKSTGRRPRQCFVVHYDDGIEKRHGVFAHWKKSEAIAEAGCCEVVAYRLVPVGVARKALR